MKQDCKSEPPVSPTGGSAVTVCHFTFLTTAGLVTQGLMQPASALRAEAHYQPFTPTLFPRRPNGRILRPFPACANRRFSSAKRDLHCNAPVRTNNQTACFFRRLMPGLPGAASLPLPLYPLNCSGYAQGNRRNYRLPLFQQPLYNCAFYLNNQVHRLFSALGRALNGNHVLG